MTRLRWLAVGLLGALALLALGRCQGMRMAAMEARIARADSVAYESAKRSIKARRTTDSLVAASLAREGELSKLRARLAVERRGTDSVVAVVRADTSSDIESLRVRLRQAVAAYDAARDRERRLEVAFDSTLGAFHRERAAWYVERETVSAQLAAKDDVIAALREAATCRILGPIPCPSRSVTALAFLAIGLAL